MRTLREADDQKIVGGKAHGLYRLLNTKGLNVPDGLVITPDDGKLATLSAMAGLGMDSPDLLLAVRSSAIGEDGTSRSWAGQYETKLNVPSSNLWEAVQDVRRGTERAKVYSEMQERARAAVLGSQEIPVVVQPMVEATMAGTLFTRNPVTGEGRLVELVNGLGDKLVSGEVTPTMTLEWFGDRWGQWDSERDWLISRLESVAVAVEQEWKESKGGVDVEWAIDSNMRVWVVQARAITAYSGKEKG